MPDLFDPTYLRLQDAIEKATRKQAVISQNVANINTPGYEALEFDAVLNKAVKRSNSKVVFEQEMAALAKNSQDHASYLRLLINKLGTLRSVVTQGRK